jgi:hypothetical protein
MAGVAALGSLTAACSGAGPTASVLEPASAARSASPSGPVTVDAELIGQRYGLKPFAPAPPPVRQLNLSASSPGVFSRVPITDRVVFVTIDDGLVKDPKFIQMVRDFQVPIAVELANLFISDDYAYFEQLYETGFVSIHNHTVNHPLNMPALPAAQQLYEISRQQEILHQHYGVTPVLFRPPGGNYDETTISAAGTAGLKGVMLWTEAMEISDMQYQTASHRLRPGDIILCHFRGPAQLDGETMVRMMTRLYRHIQAQGFTVADITKYV